MEAEELFSYIMCVVVIIVFLPVMPFLLIAIIAIYFGCKRGAIPPNKQSENKYNQYYMHKSPKKENDNQEEDENNL